MNIKKPVAVLIEFMFFLFYLYIIAEFSNKNYKIDYLMNERLYCDDQNICFDNLVCLNGTCVTSIECLDDSDCQANQACMYNICEQ